MTYRGNRAAMTTAVLVIAVAATVVSCSKDPKASAACVDPAGAACQTCRSSAAAQFCDAQYVTPQASGKITVNGQKGCCGFNDPKLRADCEAILRCVRTTGCGAGNSPTRCLCGDLDQLACAASVKPHKGPCAAVYAAAVASGAPRDIIAVFGDPKSPIGVANNTFTCEVDASCPCGQQKK
jgi:hypothetical protein